MDKVAMYKEEIVKMATYKGAPGSPRAKAYKEAMANNTPLPRDFDLLDDGMVDKAQARKSALGAFTMGASSTAGGFLGAKYLKPKLKGGIAGAVMGAGAPVVAGGIYNSLLKTYRRKKEKEESRKNLEDNLRRSNEYRENR